MRASEPVARRGTQQSRGATPNNYYSSTKHSISSHQQLNHSSNSKPIHNINKRDYPLQKLTYTNTSAAFLHSDSDSPPPKLHPLIESFLECLKWNNMTPYVIQGLYYFIRHKILWKTTLCPILWTLVFVICALCILLPLAFIPQALVLSTIMTPFLGWPLALLLALLELLVVVMIFSAIVLLPITDKLFDQVLILRGHAALVEADHGGACCGCCSVVSVMHLVLSIITLPLNLIPFVGTVLWLFLNGRLYTWDSHSHYHYELKRRKFPAQRKFVRRHWYAYHMFGMQAMALELIPGFNVLFVFTNCVGAALWAADFEDKLLQESATTATTVGDSKTSAATNANSESLSYSTEETTLPVSSDKEAYGA